MARSLVLQQRPNTFAQTILSPSFFACDKAADHTAQEMAEEHGRGKNLIATSQTELVVKLLILRMFDLLANDTVLVALHKRERAGSRAFFSLPGRERP
jgi:hypothetical protein